MNNSIADQVLAVQDGLQTAHTTVADVRRCVDAAEPRLRAWVAMSDDLDRQAEAVDASPKHPPLTGISVGVKDIIDVRGLPTRAGTILTSSEPAASDAACVARLRSLGAVIQGKTVTTEFAYLSPGPTRNPHAVEHTPGGSSSGSAAAVGAGTIPLALGTQTAGSLTRPAAFCGAAGLVFPPGSVDMSGVIGLSPSLDSLGLLTRTVEDLRYVYVALTEGAAPGTHTAAVSRVRIWGGDGVADLAPEMRALIASMPQILTVLGIDSTALGWDEHIHRLTDEHLEVMAYEAFRERRREFTLHRDLLSAPLLELLRAGEEVSPERHATVLAYRDQALGLLAEHLQGAVIVGPATPGPAPAGLQSTGVSVLSRAWQLLGLPAVAVPGARTPAGLPLGLQIVGLPGDEVRILDLGVRLERILRERHRS
jgi:Asp-tRNA(Asn)/Glu-tRNA(Gln) amidotransferase A subunit family amidase